MPSSGQPFHRRRRRPPSAPSRWSACHVCPSSVTSGGGRCLGRVLEALQMIGAELRGVGLDAAAPAKQDEQRCRRARRWRRARTAPTASARAPRPARLPTVAAPRSAARRWPGAAARSVSRRAQTRSWAARSPAARVRHGGQDLEVSCRQRRVPSSACSPSTYSASFASISRQLAITSTRSGSDDVRSGRAPVRARPPAARRAASGRARCATSPCRSARRRSGRSPHTKTLPHLATRRPGETPPAARRAPPAGRRRGCRA